MCVINTRKDVLQYLSSVVIKKGLKIKSQQSKIKEHMFISKSKLNENNYF